MKASEKVRREEKAWLGDSGCQDWLLELKDAEDVEASLEEPELGGRQSVLSNPQDKLLRLQYIRFLQASESCLLGGARKARTNVDLIVRI